RNATVADAREAGGIHPDEADLAVDLAGLAREEGDVPGRHAARAVGAIADLPRIAPAVDLVLAVVQLESRRVPVARREERRPTDDPILLGRKIPEGWGSAAEPWRGDGDVLEEAVHVGVASRQSELQRRGDRPR